LLFSVFESWMVADYGRVRLERQNVDEVEGEEMGEDHLSRTFGTMSTLNSLVAIVSGVVSEWLVSTTGTRKAPFVASVALLFVAGWVIAGKWVS
jgi:MFS transporter, MFS domain-containing protein family, molybdate-anion transporter